MDRLVEKGVRNTVENVVDDMCSSLQGSLGQFQPITFAQTAREDIASGNDAKILCWRKELNDPVDVGSVSIMSPLAWNRVCPLMNSHLRRNRAP